MKDRKMFYGASKNVFRKAFMLRNKETDAEKVLWQRLNKSQLLGFRFKPQHPIENFVADFYCHKAKLIIEVDGASHTREKQKLYDQSRTKQMNDLGLKVIRFTNDEVLNDIEKVISIISKLLCEGPFRDEERGEGEK